MRVTTLIILAATCFTFVMTPRLALAEEAGETPTAAGGGDGANTFGDAPAAQSVDELLATLRAPDGTARVAAVRALGERREASAVQPLINLLHTDPVPEVRGWAVRALHDIGNPEGRAAVVTAAREDPDERVRTMAGRLEGVSSAQPPPYTPAPAQVQPLGAQYPQYAPGYPQYRLPQRPQRVPGRGLRVGGIITTSVSYGLALLVGISLLSVEGDEWDDASSEHDWGWKLMLPIVGPAVAATTNDANEASVVFWVWSAAQIAGVTLLAVGYARRARHRREQAVDEDDPEPEASRRNFGLALLPGPGGLQLTGWF